MMMEYELHRLASFKGWSQELVSPLALARSGFWYTGSGDAVECFSCKTQFNTRVNPQEKHRERSLQCEYLRNPACNVPMKIPGCNNCVAEETTTVENSSGNIAKDNCDFHRHSNNECEKIDDQLSPLIKLYKAAFSRARQNGLFPDESESRIDRSKPDFELLKTEKNRLNTFYDWPSTANADPAELAREGLFYTGSEDRVQCAYCQGYIGNWGQLDAPSDVHRQQFSSCSFVRSHISDDVSVYADRSYTTIARTSTTSEHKTRLEVPRQSPRQPPAVPEQLPLFVGDPPKFPRFADYSARVESFRNGIVGQGQTPEGLADAGWFYVGPNDKVRCFQCGGNLRDWEQDDDPWEEHKRWYDYCQYTKTHRPQPRIRVPETPLPTMPTSAVNYRIEPREVKARMDTPTVRAILDLGYPRDKVRTVIETRLSTTGDDFANAESLLQALFQLEESTTTTSAGATDSNLTSAVTNNSAFGNYASASNSTSSRISEYSTATSSSSGFLHQSAFTSVPLIASSSKTSTTDDRKSVSLTTEAVGMATTPEALQSKTKAEKRKKKNKKKQNSTSIGGDITTVEEPGVQDNHETTPETEEIPDEDTVKYQEENRQLREARTCKVCMDAEVNTVFLPCGHLVCCATCSPVLQTCPICRTLIRGSVRTFLS